MVVVVCEGRSRGGRRGRRGCPREDREGRERRLLKESETGGRFKDGGLE